MNKCVTLCLFLIIFCAFSATAQRRNKQEIPVNTDTLPSNVVLNIYKFDYINQYPEYFNASKLQNIRTLAENKELENLYNARKDYVKRFGIRNFYKDTRLIWQLAKLTELFGEYEEAKSLYRLVLRHHQIGIDLKEIEIYYDSLNVQAAAQYVPIEYYYEMVEHRKLIDTLRPPRGILLNMGPMVNSRSADYAPTLNINSNTFSSEGN